MAIVLTDNEFFSGLSNLALFVRVYDTATSTAVKSFTDNFASETITNGNQKIFPFGNLPTVENYNATSTLLTVTKQDVKEETIKITEKKVIKASYNEYILDMAFTDKSGMNIFIGYLMGLMESAKDDYIYNQIITDLFGKTLTKPTQTIKVKFIDKTKQVTSTDKNNAELINQKRIALAIQDTINNMEVYTDKYNATGYKQALSVKDLRLVICNPYHNEQVVNLFAELLNSSVITNSFEKPEKIVIPSISVPTGKQNVIGWVMHKNAYQWFYKFIVALSFFDSSNLTMNRFLHLWFGKGFIDGLPIVQFVAELEV